MANEKRGIIDAITYSGRVYRIDIEQGRWSRFPKTGERHEVTVRLWGLKVGTTLDFPWNAPDEWEDATAPVVDKHLFITSRDIWFVSTKVKAIIPVESWESPISRL
jgi:hypothetical protein